MTPRHRLLPVPVTVLVGALLAVSLAGSGGADSAPALLQRAHDLRSANTALATRSHAALLRLYSLDSQLARAQARLDALTAQAEAVRREGVLTAKRLRIARHAVAAQPQLDAGSGNHDPAVAWDRGGFQRDAGARPRPVRVRSPALLPTSS